VLENVRIMAIDKMAKPKEVLVVQDEYGEVADEVFDDIETNAIYDSMREMLIYLTNIDCAAMDRVIQRRLDQLTGDKSYFSFERLNKLCWALGSVSGCMSSDDENKFVVSVIKELLNLCEKTSGKSNKALVASDIMYVVGQFPRFLCSHWPFLKTVIRKLNEFMHEKHPGVQDMASETFLKISKQTKHMFVMRQDGDKDPYVNELIRLIPDNLKDLEMGHRLEVYEGIGHMISQEQMPII
jgi:exportin-1